MNIEIENSQDFHKEKNEYVFLFKKNEKKRLFFRFIYFFKSVTFIFLAFIN